jgi:hypothetical protein
MEETTLMQFLNDNLPNCEIRRNWSVLIVKSNKVKMVHDYNVLEMDYIKGKLTKDNLHQIIFQ